MERANNSIWSFAGLHLDESQTEAFSDWISWPLILHHDSVKIVRCLFSQTLCVQVWPVGGRSSLIQGALVGYQSQAWGQRAGWGSAHTQRTLISKVTGVDQKLLSRWPTTMHGRMAHHCSNCGANCWRSLNRAERIGQRAIICLPSISASSIHYVTNKPPIYLLEVSFIIFCWAEVEYEGLKWFWLGSKLKGCLAR